jgi:hypothetical protein
MMPIENWTSSNLRKHMQFVDFHGDIFPVENGTHGRFMEIVDLHKY